MSIDYVQLETQPRLLLEAELEPLQGKRFQSTGFADLGAARYSVPRKTEDGSYESIEMLLIESAQSVANRMELACWDIANNTWNKELKGLPYIRVNREDGSELTNSVLEAHRINSEYIMNSGDTSFRNQFIEEIAYSTGSPVDWKLFHKALFKYDIGSLIHGCFLEEIGGRLRVTRALSGFIEARGIAPAESGGVKNNRVSPELKGGEGNVPFHRTEFVAKEIKAYFNLDLALLRGYGLGDDATRLLIALSLFKIRRFLSTGLRLRAACDLRVIGDPTVVMPPGFAVPDEDALLQECGELIKKCQPQFAEITHVKWRPNKGKKAKFGDARPEENAEANA